MRVTLYDVMSEEGDRNIHMLNDGIRLHVRLIGSKYKGLHASHLGKLFSFVNEQQALIEDSVGFLPL